MSEVFVDCYWTRVYLALVLRGQSRRKVALNGFETHHVIPKSFWKRTSPTGWLDGDPNDPSNLTVLTYREHLLAHRLLVRITTGFAREKMVDAVWQMLHSDDTAFKINGREYARLRQTHSDSVSKRLTELWKDSDYRAKQTEIQSVVQRQVFERPGYKERHRQATVQGMANPAVRAKVSAGASIAMLARWEQQDYRESRVAATTGLKNPNADQTIYHWVHQDGTVEYLTRVDMAAKYNIKSFYKLFCRNPKKSVHGWRVVKHDALDNKSL